MTVMHIVVAVSLAAVGGEAPAQTIKSLDGTAWNAVEVYGTAVPVQSPDVERQPHLVFGANGQLSGADGCNRLTGPYTAKENGLTFGEIAATRMACPVTDDLAIRFQSALKGTSHWSIVDGRLELYGATGKPLAVLERRPLTSPEK
jgi:heat shock protein HslJ